jgi:hypothetical protein
MMPLPPPNYRLLLLLPLQIRHWLPPPPNYRRCCCCRCRSATGCRRRRRRCKRLS